MSHYVRVLCITIISCMVYLASHTQQITTQTLDKLNMEIPVRVLLQENKLTATNWNLKSDHGFVIHVPSKHTTVLNQSLMTVTHKQGYFHINDLKIDHSECYIVPLKGHIQHNTIPYDGVFKISSSTKNAYLVNHLDLEDYIASVLPYESIPQWPDEVQKALCIACRTYAVSQIKGNKYRTLPYDFKNSVLDQVYKGHANKVDLSHIINQTKGLVITHKQKPILAMYSAVCGGVVPAHKHDTIFNEAPYLKRDYACTHCTGLRNYRWRSSISLKKLNRLFSTTVARIGHIQEVQLDQYDSAGVAHTVHLRGAQGSHTMDAHDFRMHLYDCMRSTCSTSLIKDGRLYMHGKGHGHHIGLCQWGAYSMVKKGHSYKDVLTYYYPDTTLMLLKPRTII